MTRPYSVAFKQKMIQRLTGKKAVRASQLARETSVRQQNLSRRLRVALRACGCSLIARAGYSGSKESRWSPGCFRLERASRV